MVSLGDRLIEFVGGLTVPNGRYAGRKIDVLPFERRFLRGAFGQPDDSALTMGRGNGKTTHRGGIVGGGAGRPSCPGPRRKRPGSVEFRAGFNRLPPGPVIPTAANRPGPEPMAASRFSQPGEPYGPNNRGERPGVGVRSPATSRSTGEFTATRRNCPMAADSS